MSNIILGLAGAIGHDPAAALYIDGELVAACEEERFVRRKHARDEAPYLAARACLQIGGVRGQDVTQVAIPFAPISLFTKARWHYAYRHWYAPDRAIDSVLNGNRRYRRYRRDLSSLLDKLHIPAATSRVVPVQHQLAHAASATLINPQAGRTPLFCSDAKGEYSALFLGYAEAGKIVRVKEFYNPDSLAGMYAALTDYLGFEALDGEFKVMGIAPFGDPDKYDLTSLAKFNGRRLKINNHLVGTVGIRRYKAQSKGHYFSRQLVEMLGPRRVGSLIDDPYVHYAAAIQALYENLAVKIVKSYLGDMIHETGRLAIAGTSSLNIRLNQKLGEIDGLKELLINPASGDAGTAIGAAAFAASKQSEPLKPAKHFFLGPKFTRNQCVEACKGHREKPVWEILDDPHAKAVELLKAGEVIGWFRGRMEFGARALGNRSILADPSQPGIAQRINKLVKFRESWRPFSASLLESAADDYIDRGKLNSHDEAMALSVKTTAKFREVYPDVVHVDGTARLQVVRDDNNADFHSLLSQFADATGQRLLINTALNRPGEALVCTPEDAINAFHGTDLNYLILGDLLVSKREEVDDW